jgi:hypothetical protein
VQRIFERDASGPSDMWQPIMVFCVAATLVTVQDELPNAEDNIVSSCHLAVRDARERDELPP